VFTSLAIKDLLGDMPLFGRVLAILLQNRVNDGQEFTQLGSGRLAAIARRLSGVENLFEGAPVNVVLTASGSLAQVTREDSAAHSCPHIHVAIHSAGPR
jgi:hypothetical protein